MKSNLSLLLLTHNESENIKKNLNWLRECPILNEIIVVDDDSTDNTIAIIKSLKLPKTTKINIVKRSLNKDFSAQRQFGVGESSNDWILWLDPDEIPSSELIQFLNNFNPKTISAFQMHRVDYFGGITLKHGETSTNNPIRVFNRTYGQFVGKVHETWNPTSPITNTNLTIKHYSHPNLKSFLEKINFYSDIRAKELFDQKVPYSAFQIFFYPLGKFIVNYFFKLGFLDGTPGIIMAITMSFHSFLVRSKLWHLWQK